LNEPTGYRLVVLQKRVVRPPDLADYFYRRAGHSPVRPERPAARFHPTRQFFSALKARGMYYAMRPGTPQWMREVSYKQWQAQGKIDRPSSNRWQPSPTWRWGARI
jgi:hypothetical protein